MNTAAAAATHAFAARCAAFDALVATQSALHAAHYFTGSATEVNLYVSSARAAAISAHAAYILARDDDAAAYALQCDIYRTA